MNIKTNYSNATEITLSTQSKPRTTTGPRPRHIAETSKRRCNHSPSRSSTARDSISGKLIDLGLNLPDSTLISAFTNTMKAAGMNAIPVPTYYRILSHSIVFRFI